MEDEMIHQTRIPLSSNVLECSQLWETTCPLTRRGVRALISKHTCRLAELHGAFKLKHLIKKEIRK